MRTHAMSSLFLPGSGSGLGLHHVPNKYSTRIRINKYLGTNCVTLLVLLQIVFFVFFLVMVVYSILLLVPLFSFRLAMELHWLAVLGCLSVLAAPGHFATVPTQESQDTLVVSRSADAVSC